MKHFVLLLLYVSIGLTLSAQEELIANEIERPNLILKWSPSPLVSFTAPTMQFSVEYPIGKKTQHFYLEHDLGYVIGNPNFSDEYSSGFRVATKIKHYFRPMNTSYNNFFVSFMARYTLRAEKSSRFFERAGGAYQQQYDITKQNKYAAGYLEFGYLRRFGESKRVIFESLLSAGASYYTTSFKGIPDDAEEVNDRGGWIGFPTDTLLPSVLMVLKFGYILK